MGKIMKKFLAMVCAAALVLAMFTGCGGSQTDLLQKIKEEGKMTVALSPDFAPMEFVDISKSGQDQYVGFDVTLAQYIADELGVELVIEAMSFDASQAAVSTKAVTMSISGYSYTEDRAENFEISDGYYTNNESNQCILVPAGQAADYAAAEAFSGKKLGAQNASLQYDLLTSQLPDAEPSLVTDLNTGVLELAAGNIDGLCVAKGNGEMIMDANPGQFEFATWEFAIDDDANVILLPKGETALLEEVNKILAKANEAGYYPVWYAEAVGYAKSANAQEVSIPDEGGADSEG